jgi:hypothetical protein
MSELNAAHGSGSWEGATPQQIWTHPSRGLTTRSVDSEKIASEEMLREIREILEKPRASFRLSA